jgi:hypothetical protein
MVQTYITSNLLILLNGRQYVGEEKIWVEQMGELIRHISVRYANGFPVAVEVFDLEAFQFKPLTYLQQLDSTSIVNVITDTAYAGVCNALPLPLLQKVVLDTTHCLQSSCFVWRSDTKMVLVDVDGTITRSDVRGYLMPFIGRDWLQPGVVNFMAKIRNNGYGIVYLSSRALGQAIVTSKYFRKLEQDNCTLPEGPIVLSPETLGEQFYRDIIEKDPNRRKLRILSLIKAATQRSPFYAGFGNIREDTELYRELGLPDSRIFQVDPRGVVTCIGTGQRLNYSEWAQLIDQLFPPTNDSILTRRWHNPPQQSMLSNPAQQSVLYTSQQGTPYGASQPQVIPVERNPNGDSSKWLDFVDHVRTFVKTTRTRLEAATEKRHYYFHH